MKGMIFIDVNKCLGCKSCEMQCAIEHSKSKDLFKALAECPIPQGRVKVEKVQDLAVPLQCRHCEDAPCIKVCPSKALDRENAESPVLIDQERCIGCKMCVIVCPFGVIRTDKKGKAMIKCDMCFERLKRNELPVCVVSCPTKALEFKTSEGIAKDKRKDYLTHFKK